MVNEGFNHIQPDHLYLLFAFDIVNKELTAERPLPHNMSHSQIFKCTLVESDINKVTLHSVNRRWKVWQTNILLNQPKNLYKHEAHAFIRRKITTYRPFSCYVHAKSLWTRCMNEWGWTGGRRVVNVQQIGNNEWPPHHHKYLIARHILESLTRLQWRCTQQMHQPVGKYWLFSFLFRDDILRPKVGGTTLKHVL